MSEDLLSGLSGRLRQRIEDGLDPRETVRAVVRGKSKEALVLTDHRIIIANGTLLLGGFDSLLVSDVARVTSGLTAMNIQLRSGDVYEFNFWPKGEHRDAAKRLVETFRSGQLSDTSPSSDATPASQGSVADELAKLAQLRNDGVLTEEEFDEQKAGLLKKGDA